MEYIILFKKIENIFDSWKFYSHTNYGSFFHRPLKHGLSLKWYSGQSSHFTNKSLRVGEWLSLDHKGYHWQHHNWNSLLPMIPDHLLHSSSTICSQLHLIRAPIHTFNVYKLQGEAILRICYEIKCPLGSVTKNGISPRGF